MPSFAMSGLASAKTIELNGGVLETARPARRYWIDLAPADRA